MRILITGVTGQDGWYLSRQCHIAGHEVHGIVRRTTARRNEVWDKVTLHDGDMQDASSLQRIVGEVKPDIVFNLAAQSFVGTSWKQAELTNDINHLGVIRLLEACRTHVPDCYFLQASTSEMFGNSPGPQNEATPFDPQSPYAISKVAAFFTVNNYATSYKMAAHSVICFNHECVAAETPLIVRRRGLVEVVQPPDLIGVRGERSPYGNANIRTKTDLEGLEIWDGTNWTAVQAITATRIRSDDTDHVLRSTETRGGTVATTSHHQMLTVTRDSIRADAVQVDQAMALGEYPPISAVCLPDGDFAEFLGLMVADGYVSEDGQRMNYAKNDDALRARVTELWLRVFGGIAKEVVGVSGFTGGDVSRLVMRRIGGAGVWLRELMYTFDACKRVPIIILNASAQIRRRFLDGYYAGNGLKAGNGDAFKTNSPVLAQGLCWLYSLEGQRASIYIEARDDDKRYYAVNLGSAHHGNKGQHLRKDPAKVKVLRTVTSKLPWVFDLATDSEVFMAGVGRLVIHNSPRRGDEFVTQKIIRALVRMKAGHDVRLQLGNLQAARDWGLAPEYTQAMLTMATKRIQSNLVLATGETNTVATFLQLACDHIGIDITDQRISYDPSQVRPSEVNCLRGDATLAARYLGWEAQTKLPGLIARMAAVATALLKDPYYVDPH